MKKKNLRSRERHFSKMKKIEREIKRQRKKDRSEQAAVIKSNVSHSVSESDWTRSVTCFQKTLMM